MESSVDGIPKRPAARKWWAYIDEHGEIAWGEPDSRFEKHPHPIEGHEKILVMEVVE